MANAGDSLRGLLVFFLGAWGVLAGCAAQQAPVEVTGGLPPDKLAHYHDSFNELRQDLWDRAGIVYRQDQLENYRAADLGIENGKLVIQTHVGSFSKGGLISNFKLRGDYDFQIDCRLDFLDHGGEMDQVLAVGVMEEGPAGAKARIFAAISLVKPAGKGSGIFAGYREGKQLRSKSWHPTGDFTGSLRVVRSGDRIATFYRKKGGSWRRANVFPSISGDTRLGLAVQNFTMGRRSIHATKQVVGSFDNFRINAAQEIIEPEI